MTRHLIENTVSLGKPMTNGDRLVVWACIETDDSAPSPDVQMETLSNLRKVLAAANATVAVEPEAK